MSLSSQVFLGALRLQAQQRADLENNPSVSIPEWNTYLSQSVKALKDLLIAAYGDEYEFSTPFQFTASSRFSNLPDGSATYLAPDGSVAPAFYKLLGVDLQSSNSPTGWVTLGNFNFINRNKSGNSGTPINIHNRSELKYRIMGNQLMWNMIPTAGRIVQIWYAPKPTSLIFSPVCSTVFDSATIGISDTVDMLVGMSVNGPGIARGTTVTAVDTTNNQVTLSIPATATAPVVCLQFWIDSASFDGIAGWEEFVVIDAAIKACIKQESPVADGLILQRNEIKERIQDMAKGRDIGQAEHVTDALSIQGECGGGFDGGWDGGW